MMKTIHIEQTVLKILKYSTYSELELKIIEFLSKPSQWFAYHCGIITNRNGGILAYSPSETSILE